MTDKIFRISVREQGRMSSCVQEQHGLVFLKRSVHESNRSKHEHDRVQAHRI